LSSLRRYRVALGLALCLGPWPQATFAAEIIREELRMPAAGPRGLEALLVRSDEPGRHPLVLLNHGSPRVAAERPDMSPNELLPEAIELVRRGWTAAMMMR
jgi:hypothetical protein